MKFILLAIKSFLVLFLIVIIYIIVNILSFNISHNIKANFINNVPSYPTATNIIRNTSWSHKFGYLNNREYSIFSFNYNDIKDRKDVIKFYDEYLLSKGWKKTEIVQPLKGEFSAWIYPHLDYELKTDDGQIYGINDSLSYTKKFFGINFMISIENGCSVPNSYNLKPSQCSFSLDVQRY